MKYIKLIRENLKKKIFEYEILKGLKSIITEIKIKKGSPEELEELLKFLPVDETAKDLTEQIMSDLKSYYSHEAELPSIKTYIHHPEDRCLKPYELEVEFLLRGNNSVVGIGYSEQYYIQLYIIDKDVPTAYHRVLGLPDKLFDIIKHECSHHYLGLKDVEACLYHTHPDGMKKYYYDRQELVLHSREIFDKLNKRPNWRGMSLDDIKKHITSEVKRLRDHTYIYQPFPQSLQNKYIAFIMNNYVKPNINKPK